MVQKMLHYLQYKSVHFQQELKEKYVAYRKDMADKVLADNAALQAELNK